MKYLLVIAVIFSFIITSCNSNVNIDDPKVENKINSIEDFHSYSNISEIHTTHLHLDLDVNFDNKTIYGIARHQMSSHNVEEAVFDIKGLEILKVTIGKNDEKITDHIIGEFSELMGQSLSVKINKETEFINIYYQTTDKTEALDWLAPELTTGKVHPYLYTQGQAILTRSWIPIQDSPMNRISYSADVKVPSELIALMSAKNPTSRNDEGKYHFEMEQKIPSYLIALAVGDLVYTSLGDNCGIYSEKELAEECAYEFVDLPKMISAAENLYGPYLWEQYDIVMLPYSFPFGGMENPRLTFANPTLLAGDRSSTSVIAHELAHSWSGNLVTNATWEDFWLNEGFTVYFENRIMEQLYGEEVADILATIEYQDLLASLEAIENSDFPEDSQLKLKLDDRSPDEGMTDIAYVKGATFLRTLEQSVGREKMDEFLVNYFVEHSFKSITTEEFLTDLKTNLLEPNSSDFNPEDWIYKPGIPDDHYQIKSERLENMILIAEKANKAEDIFESDLKNLDRSQFITQEWLTFIRSLDKSVTKETLAQLDAQFKFSSESNAIIKSDWFKLLARCQYRDANEEMESFLIKIGRRWLIEGIYQSLMDSDSSIDHEFAKSVFDKAKNGYHFVSRSTIREIVN